jgi:probable O-glycosylation ligase (exosortase A-associated)
MRALLLVGVVACLALYGFLVPQVGVYAYIWFSLFRPDVVAFGAGTYAYSQWLALTLMAGSIRFLPNAPRAWIFNPVTLSLILLEIPMAISRYTAPFPYFVEYDYNLFVRMSLALLFIPLVITAVEDFKRLYVVTAISLGTWGLWHGATGVLHGGLRIYNGIGGFMTENNTFACGLTMVIPFCWYSRLLVKSRPLKLLLQAMTWGSVACTVLTFSRGAAVALAFILLIMVLQSKRKALALVGILLIGVGPAVYLVGHKYLNRMSSIATYEQDQSAMSRIVLMKAAVEVWRTRPFFGVGMGSESFMVAAEPFVEGTIGAHLVVHNSYLQMLAECGIFAFLLYVYMMVSVLWRAWRSSRRLKETNPDFLPYPRAIQLSMMAYMICSLTQPRYSFDFLYMIVMYAAAWYSIEKNLPQEATAPVPGPPPWSPPTYQTPSVTAGQNHVLP